MKNLNIILFAVLFSILFNGSIKAQNNKAFFVGLQPGITAEKFYEKNEFDLNIIPFVFQYQLGDRTDLRIVTIANYHFGGETNGFSDIGINTILPIFLKKDEGDIKKSAGFYLGPLVGFGRNLINDHYTYTIGVEPGYMFKADNRFTLSIGCQFGGSYFNYDSSPDIWRNHFGPKVNLGFWIF